MQIAVNNKMPIETYPPILEKIFKNFKIIELKK